MSVNDPDHRGGLDCLDAGQIELIAAGAPAAESAQRHLEGCGVCRSRVEAASENIDFIAAYAADDSATRSKLMPDKLASDALQPSEELDISPDLLAGYRLIAPIHAGGQGVVYKAIDLQTQRMVAIKMLLAGRFATVEQVRRFEREAEISAGLDHPNIVTIYHMLRVRGERYAIVMEFIDGVPLDRWLPHDESEKGHAAARRRLTALARLFIGVCEGVQHAHNKGSLHQDLKPSNILVKGEGVDAVAKVVDFGMARPLRSDVTAITQQGHFGGTIRYASPERIRATSDATIRADVRSDIYSLGVILYELMCGRWPFDDRNSLAEELNAIEHVAPASPSGCNRAIDKDLETILLRALHKDPLRRYDSAGALGRDLAHWLAGEAVEARRDSGIYQLRKAARRYRVPLGIVTVVVGLGIALLLQALKVKTTNLNAALAELSANMTSKDTDVMEARLKAALRHDPRGERMLWRVLIETFRRRDDDSALAEADRQRYRREAMWALRDLYASDPCRATAVLSALPKGATLEEGAAPRLLWLDDTGAVNQTLLPWLQPDVLSGEEAERARIVLARGMLPGSETTAAERRTARVRFTPGAGRLWLTNAGGESAHELLGHTAPVVFASEFAPGARAAPAAAVRGREQWIVSIDEGRTAKVWRIGTQPWGLAAHAHQGAVATLWFGSDGSLRSSGADGAARVWSIDAGLLSEHAVTTPRLNASVLAAARAAGVFAVAPNSERLAVGDSSGAIRVVNADSGEEVWKRSVGDGRARGLAWSPDSSVLGVLTSSGQVRMWKASGSSLRPPSRLDASRGGGDSTLTAIGLERAGSRVLIGSSSGFMHVVEGGESIWFEYPIANESVVAISAQSAGEFHAVAFSHAVAVMDAKWNGKLLMWLPVGEHAPITCVASSEDGRFIAAGDAGGALHLWDLNLYDDCIRGNLEYQIGAYSPLAAEPAAINFGELRAWAAALGGSGPSQPAGRE